MPPPPYSSKGLRQFNFKKAAFTLAETLITLAIIGVIAAMTIPTLLKKYEEQKTVSRLLKVQSTLSNAFMMAQNEHGNISTWNVQDDNMDSVRECFSYIEPYLKIVKKCDNKSGCWAGSTKALSGQIALWSGNGHIGSGYIGAVLFDGTNIIFDTIGYYREFFGLPADVYPMPYIWVDVNGNKKPNIVGRDIFAFGLTKRGVLPLGVNDNSQNCSKTINTNTSGFGCTYRVLKERKINY